jgi:hypothetical protein
MCHTHTREGRGAERGPSAAPEHRRENANTHADSITSVGCCPDCVGWCPTTCDRHRSSGRAGRGRRVLSAGKAILRSSLLLSETHATSPAPRLRLKQIYAVCGVWAHLLLQHWHPASSPESGGERCSHRRQFWNADLAAPLPGAPVEDGQPTSLHRLPWQPQGNYSAQVCG